MLARTKFELETLKNTHNKFLKYRKDKAKHMKTVPEARHKQLKNQLREKDDVIKDLAHQNLLLQESIEELKSIECKDTKADGKTYSSSTRLKVFDCIVNKVPTANIPVLLRQLEKRSGNELQSVPQRSTVELMARELGAVAELQAAETLLETKNATIGFDATTQEGTHINSIHFTTSKECVAAAIDELPGRTADDYAGHICKSVDSMAETYVYFHEGKNFPDTRTRLISNITNSMTDRCAANHAALRIVGSVWKKNFNELNCHLHPLDSIATACLSTLKQHEESRGKLFGNDSMAGNIVYQMNRLRYKDGKGDPKGFLTFLERNNLPKGILPRYRGNRLHILFHIAGVLIEHHSALTELLRSGTSLGGLRSGIYQDFTNEVGKHELQVLGILGRHLTGPWMRKFYTSAEKEINHIDGIGVVRDVLVSLQEMLQDPAKILTATTDFFGAEIVVDGTLLKLRSLPPHPEFSAMMKSCLQAVINVLERQYSKYFALDITNKLREETASARSHNIDAEEIMGMFSAAQQKSPNATLCFLSSRMRACKNKTVAYLDTLTNERREEVSRKAVRYGRLQRDRRRKSQKEVRLELIKRQKQKEQVRNDAQRKKVEKMLKSGLDATRKEFPDLDYSKQGLTDLLDGKAVGKRICHVWFEEDGLVVYNGLIRKLYANKYYKVAYWSKSEVLDDATDYNMSMYALAADFLHSDLEFADWPLDMFKDFVNWDTFSCVRKGNRN